MSESGTTEAQGSINAYDPEYRNALEDRDIHFAEKTDTPRDFDELRQAMLLPGKSPEPQWHRSKESPCTAYRCE